MLTAHDVKFLTACGIVADEENFRLETLWRNWQRANLHRDFSPCHDCGAKTYKQHALDCKHGAAMVFVASTPDDGALRLTTEQLAAKELQDVKLMSPEEKAEARAFLQASKIDPGVDADHLALAQRIAKHPAPIQLDGTMRLLEKFGIPVTRENYLRLAFAGNPPQEPLDGEIEAELPLELQIADINNAPSAGDCGEPDYTTLRGFPICSRCGRSTRNKNALVCAPCRNRTRLVLTDEDKQFLREIGISR
jgi:hypothetical protein